MTPTGPAGLVPDRQDTLAAIGCQVVLQPVGLGRSRSAATCLRTFGVQDDHMPGGIHVVTVVSAGLGRCSRTEIGEIGGSTAGWVCIVITLHRMGHVEETTPV